MTDECRRKASHSSSEFFNHAYRDRQHDVGFINKLVADIKKLYVYPPNEKIRWMNEKPKNRKAYEPTEVGYWFFPK